MPNLATIIVFLVIATLIILSLKSFIKGKGSCGDCGVSCPVKEEMHRQNKTKS